MRPARAGDKNGERTMTRLSREHRGAAPLYAPQVPTPAMHISGSARRASARRRGRPDGTVWYTAQLRPRSVSSIPKTGKVEQIKLGAKAARMA